MIHLTRILSVLPVILGLATPATADWTVVRASPPVRYAVDGQTWLPLSAGMEVPADARIRTGRSGRLLLRRASELIQFKPNTVASLASQVGTEGSTLFREFGDIFLGVRWKTRVETPYAGAMERGRRLRVSVGLDEVGQRVVREAVEARDLARSERVEAGAGQRTTVRARGDRRMRVLGPGQKAGFVRVRPREPRVRPARRAASARPAAEGVRSRVCDDDVADAMVLERARIAALARLARKRNSVRGADAEARENGVGVSEEGDGSGGRTVGD